MTQDALLEIDNRRPFVPYTLRLNSGDVVRVEKPEHCLITEDGGKLKFISVVNIAMVE